MPVADAGEMNIYTCVWLAGCDVVYSILQRWSGVQGVLAREMLPFRESCLFGYGCSGSFLEIR